MTVIAPIDFGRGGRLSVPGPGLVLSSESELRSAPIRKAVGLIKDRLRGADSRAVFLSLFGDVMRHKEFSAQREPVIDCVAWAMTTIYVIGRCAGELTSRDELSDAEAWFGGDVGCRTSLSAIVDKDVCLRAKGYLDELAFDADLQELLPYVLEPHGPGSRRSVLKDPSTASTRLKKREHGVFYTPADVAEFMCEQALALHGGNVDELKAVDPACGTGVYLRALVRNPRHRSDALEYIINCVFGIDISELAIQAAAFVLLNECIDCIKRERTSPREAWQRIRRNLWSFDATEALRTGADGVLVSNRGYQNSYGTFSNGVAFESSERMDQANAAGSAALGALSIVFPEVQEGFDLLIGNPPYAPLGRLQRSDLSTRFKSVHGRPSARDNLFPLFIEMMWGLTRLDHHSAALVVPLSIAYHRGTQLNSCREAMMEVGGEWRFAFFDREPHSLFGEDVKTRNAIIFHRQTSDGKRALFTTSLQKWTSRSRDKLFSSLKFTELTHSDIRLGIPKIGSTSQARALRLLQGRNHYLGGEWVDASPFLLRHLVDETDRPRIFLASTAYNFLNVFRWYEMRPMPGHLSENPVLAMEFASESKARVMLAVLSSRLIFWYWQALCDGFHVPRWFVEAIPFTCGSFSNAQHCRLAKLGESLWRCIQKEPLISVNGGRSSIAFRPFLCEEIRDGIDEILIEAAGIDSSFAAELKSFVRRAVVVDSSDLRREHFDVFAGQPEVMLENR